MMNQLEQLDAYIATEMQLYREPPDAPALDDISPADNQKYRLSQQNVKQNLDRVHLYQEIRNWLEVIREEMLTSDPPLSEEEALARLERKIIDNIPEKDLVSAEVLQRVNIWLNEIRHRGNWCSCKEYASQIRGRL
jgi:hypothetical protein